MSERDAHVMAEWLFGWNSPTDPFFVINGRVGDLSTEDPYVTISRAILSSSVMRQMLAEAWDAGSRVGFEAGNVTGWNNGRGDFEEVPDSPNPYRETNGSDR